MRAFALALLFLLCAVLAPADEGFTVSLLGGDQAAVSLEYTKWLNAQIEVRASALYGADVKYASFGVFTPIGNSGMSFGVEVHGATLHKPQVQVGIWFNGGKKTIPVEKTVFSDLWAFFLEQDPEIKAQIIQWAQDLMDGEGGDDE